MVANRVRTYPSGVLLAICLAAIVPSRSGALVNDDLRVGELVGDDSRDNASAAPCRKGIDNRNWPDQIGLPPSEAPQGQRGSQTQKPSTAGSMCLPPTVAITNAQVTV
jgi:hypothetical protein